MKINSIKIEKLFDIFDYDISFKENENILIITGPNGFGKTMILNIIFSLFNRKFMFFQELVFEKITLNLDEDIQIVISKKIIGKNTTGVFNFFWGGINKEKFEIAFNPAYKFKIGYSDSNFDELQKIYINPLDSPLIDQILNSISVYLIKE